MEISVAKQFAELLYAIAFGFCSGFFYDFLRAVRSVLPKSKVITILCDALFWLVLLPAAFIFNMLILSGELRWFVLAGMVLGGSVYFILPGKLFRRMNTKLRRLLTKLLRKNKQVKQGKKEIQ